MKIVQYITDFLQNWVKAFTTITFFDVIDILLLTILIYYVIKLVKETRAMQLLKGIGILIIIFLLVQVCQLKAMSYLMENFLQVGIMAIIIVFQPELRRILEKVGRTKVRTIALNIEKMGTNDNPREKAINEIAQACDDMHRSKTGALIVIERDTKLGDVVEESTIINAEADSKLLLNLFYKGSPLHDGAVVIRANRVYAAGCFIKHTACTAGSAAYEGAIVRICDAGSIELTAIFTDYTAGEITVAQGQCCFGTGDINNAAVL